MPSTHSLISDKARCFSQSERALYGNFVINEIVNRTLTMYSDHLQVTTAVWIFDTYRGLLTGNCLWPAARQRFETFLSRTKKTFAHAQ